MTSARQHHNGGRGSYDGGPPPATSIPLSVDTAADAAAEQSIGALVRDVSTHLSTLIRAEIELARAEIATEVKKGAKGSAFFLLAMGLAMLLLPFALVTLALVISIWLPQWAGFGIVTLLMAVAAVWFGLAGFRRMRRISAPQRTISTMRDTAAALKRPGESVT